MVSPHTPFPSEALGFLDLSKVWKDLYRSDTSPFSIMIENFLPLWYSEKKNKDGVATMKEKLFKIKPIYWILAAVLLVILVLPVFLTKTGVGCSPLTRTIFSVSPEDEIAVILDCSPEEGWSAELTGADREEAVAVLNRMRYRYYYLDPAIIIPSGSGWERSVWLRTGDGGERYKLWENHIQIGWLIFQADTEPLMALFDKHCPDGLQ